jgi:hypothetical protein
MIAIQAGDWEAMSLEDSIHISPCHSCRTLPPYGVTPTDLDGHLLFLFVFLLSFIQVAIQVGVYFWNVRSIPLTIISFLTICLFLFFSFLQRCRIMCCSGRDARNGPCSWMAAKIYVFRKKNKRALLSYMT